MLEDYGNQCYIVVTQEEMNKYLESLIDIERMTLASKTIETGIARFRNQYLALESQVDSLKAQGKKYIYLSEFRLLQSKIT